MPDRRVRARLPLRIRVDNRRASDHGRLPAVGARARHRVTVTETGYTQGDLVATGVVGEMAQRSPFAMCASGWGEALTLLKFYLEHDVVYGSVPP